MNVQISFYTPQRFIQLDQPLWNTKWSSGEGQRW